MKKVKAFTLIEVMIIVAIIGILAAMVIPAFIHAKAQTNREQNAITAYHIGDSVYIESLGVTGIVNRSVVGINWNYVDLIVKSTNGAVAMLNDVDARLVKRVPPSPESEWKR